MENPEQILTWINVGIGVVVLLAPFIGAIIGLTQWGKSHKGALDEVVEVVGQMKKANSPISNLLQLMSAKEKSASPSVVKAWKKARDRRDPKPKGGN